MFWKAAGVSSQEGGGGDGPAAAKPEVGLAAKQPARAPEQLPAKPIPAAAKARTKVPPTLQVGPDMAPIAEASAAEAVAQQTPKAAASKTAGLALAVKSTPGAAPAAAPEGPKTPQSDLRPELGAAPSQAKATTAKDEMGAAPSKVEAMDEDVVYSEDAADALLADALRAVKKRRQEQMMESQDQSPGGR